MKEYLSVKEAADLLGATPQTLRNWEKAGSLVPYRNPINKYRMYKLSQIESFIEEMATNRNRHSKFRLKVRIIGKNE